LFDRTDPIALFAKRVDLRDPALADVEELLFEQRPDALADNHSVSPEVAARYLGTADGYTFNSEQVARLLRARLLTASERTWLLSAHRADNVVLTFLRHQDPTASDIAALLQTGIGNESADYLLNEHKRLLADLPDLGAVIDRASPLTRMMWLSVSGVGDYPQYAERWIETAPAQLSPWVPRLAAVHRPDLLASFLVAPHRKVREAMARSGFVITPDDQRAVVRLPTSREPVDLLQWLAVDGPSALALVLSTPVDAGLLQELSELSVFVVHAAKELKKQLRASSVLYRAVCDSSGDEAEGLRMLFVEKANAKTVERERHANLSARDFKFRTAPVRVPGNPRPCSESVYRLIANFEVPILFKEIGQFDEGLPLTSWLVRAIGTNRSTWELMFTLLPTWSSTLGLLVDTVTSLDRTSH
jgi:hypothetical protein